MHIIKKLFKFGGESDFGLVNNIIITLVGFALIVFGWYFISINNIIPANILPNPFNVIGCYDELITEYHMFGNAWFSLKMNLMCYVYAIGLSLPIGFIITLCPFLNLLIGRTINTIRFLPFVAITSIFVAIFGLTFNMKVQFLSAALMVYIIPTVVNKVNDLQNPKNDKDNVYLQTIKTMGATNWQKFRYVYWPYVTSGIADTCRDLLAVSWTYVTVAELIYKDGEITGLGALINTMIRQSNISEAYALIILIILIGFSQDLLFGKIIKLLFPYKK